MTSLIKKENSYRITIEEINSKDGGHPNSLTFEVQDRENMFAIVDKLSEKSGLDEQTSKQVGVALRLLGTALMKNRKHPLFVDFMPHFKNFMVNLKNTMKNS